MLTLTVPFLIAIIFLLLIYPYAGEDKRMFWFFLCPFFLVIAGLIPIQSTEKLIEPDEVLHNKHCVVAVIGDVAHVTTDSRIVNSSALSRDARVKYRVWRTGFWIPVISTESFEIVLEPGIMSQILMRSDDLSIRRRNNPR